MLYEDTTSGIIGVPPDYLDGAKVIKWAWSGQVPFGYVCSTDYMLKVEIYGLAICQYETPMTSKFRHTRA